MPIIDENVVGLEFSNSGFNNKVQETTKAIQEMKKQLDFEESLRSVGKLSSSLDQVSFQKMSDDLSKIAGAFSMTGIIAITTLTNIANMAVETGKKIFSSLFIDPSKLGYKEYETQMGAIQTILANTSKDNVTLEQVTAALDELNEYSDKTIYNFTEMTKNIGTFTAAGIKLDTATAAIKGIANLAAVSGSNSQQASTAMYQLSQALAAGRVTLMDWNSVVNAGMGGKVFQDALMETARVHNVAIDQMVKDQGSFRNTLQEGWLTSEILTETLSKFTGDLTEDQLLSMGYTKEQIVEIMKLATTASDAATKVKTITQLVDTLKEANQSGWAKTWQILIGDFEEAKLLMTEISDVFGGMINASSDARNAFLTGWDSLGGRKEIIDALRHSLYVVLDLLKPIKEAFTDIFPPMTFERFYEITKSVTDFIKGIKIGVEFSEKLGNIFRGLFSIFDIVKMFVESVSKVVFGSLLKLEPTVKSIFDFLSEAGVKITDLRNKIKEADSFNAFFEKLITLVTEAKSKIKSFFTFSTEGFGSFEKIDFTSVINFIESVKVKIAPLGALFEILFTMLKIMGQVLSKMAPIIIRVSEIIGTAINVVLDKIANFVNNFKADEFLALLNSGLFAGLLLSLQFFIANTTNFVSDIVKVFSNFVTSGTDFIGGIGKILSTVGGALESWQNSLRANTLLSIAAAIGVMAIALVLIAGIDTEKLIVALGAVTVMFAQLAGTLFVMEKMPGFDMMSSMAVSASLIGMSIALLILASAIKKIGDMDSKVIVRGIVALSTMSSMLVFSAKALSKAAPSILGASISLVIFSKAVNSLVKAVVKLSALELDELSRGLIGLGSLLLSLSLFISKTSFSGVTIKGVLGIVILSAALNVLALAVKQLSEIDPISLAKGLLGIGVLLTQMFLFTSLMKNPALILNSSIGILIMAGALLVLGKSVESLGSMEWEALGRGLAGVAGGLAILITAMSFIPPNVIIGAGSLLIVTASLLLLSKAVRDMGGMTWEQLGVSMAALGASMVILAAALYGMTAGLPGAAALLVTAGALLILVPSLLMLSKMNLGELLIGLGGLAIALGLLAIAGLYMTPVIPTLLGLAAALFLVGLGVAGLGVGIFALGLGLTALAAAGSAGFATFMLALTGIIGLIPMIVKQLGEAILSLINTLVKGAPELLKGIVVLLLGLIEGLGQLVPSLVNLLMTLIDSVITALDEKLPGFIEAGWRITFAILEGLSKNIGEVVDLAVDIINKFVSALGSKLPEMTDAGYDLMVGYIDSLNLAAEKNIPRLTSSLVNLGIAIVKGVVKGVFEARNLIFEAIRELGQTLIDEFKYVLGIQSPSTVFYDLAKEVVYGFVNGLKENFYNIVNIADEFANKFVDNVKIGYENMKSVARTYINYFVLGVGETLYSVVNSAISLANSFVSKIQEYYNTVREVARTVINYFVDGITSYIYSAVNAAQSMITSFINKINEYYYSMRSAAIYIINSFIDGIRDYIYSAVDAAYDLAEGVLNKLRSYYNSMRSAAIYLVNGFTSGIRDYIYSAVDAAYDLAESVMDIIRDTLNINSPSLVMYDVGMFVAQGLALGIKDNTDIVTKVAESMSKDVVSSYESLYERLKYILENDTTISPTITPVIDAGSLSKIRRGIEGLGLQTSLGFMNQVGVANAISNSVNGSNSPVQLKENSSTNNQTLIFNQTITSPNALSRLDIYRHTRNLLTFAKGAS